MKKIIYLCAILFCSIGFVFAQGEDAGLKKPKKPIVKKKTSSEIADAENAWSAFYPKFREIVKNQDKVRLAEIIASDFNSTFGEDKAGYLNTMIQEDISRWERLEGMKKVSRLLNKGNDYLQSKKYLRKIVGEKIYDNGRKISVCQNSKKMIPAAPNHLFLNSEAENGCSLQPNFVNANELNICFVQNAESKI